jgi:hypothetical protein
LLAAIKEPRPAVLLHYCAYGYHRQGLPLWLYQGIHSWLGEGGGGGAGRQRQFSTVFYETMATAAKPWKKEFCLQFPQKWLVQEIHRRGRLAITHCEHLQAFLDGIEPDKTLRLPVMEKMAGEHGRNLDWKWLANQYQAALFQVPTYALPGRGIYEVPVEVLKGSAPTYAQIRSGVGASVGIRPRPA